MSEPVTATMIIGVLRDLGFPVAVACWLLLIYGKKIDRLTSAIWQLCSVLSKVPGVGDVPMPRDRDSERGRD